MVRKWLPDRCHPKRVTENLTLNSEVTFDRGNLLGGSRAGNVGRSQQDGGVPESAFCDFHDSIGCDTTSSTQPGFAIRQNPLSP